jgi:hypothetical protein
VTGVLGIVGWTTLPRDRRKGFERLKPDFCRRSVVYSRPDSDIICSVEQRFVAHAFTITVRKFANSLTIGVGGWNKAFIIALLIGSVEMLCIFTWVEKKASNLIIPLGLWQLPNFAGLWIAGFGE